MDQHQETLRQLINAKCADCIYDAHVPGNWRQQTDACTVRACPLWPIRPQAGQDQRTGPTLRAILASRRQNQS